MDDYEQTREEREAHLAGVVAAAREWCTRISDPVMCGVAWREWTGDPLRTRLAGIYVEANRHHPWLRQHDPDVLTAQIASGTAPAAILDAFLKPLAATLSDMLEDITNGRAGAASRPRPIGPGLEVVRFVDTDGQELHITEPTVMLATSIALRHDGGRWLVIGVNDPDFDPPA